MPPKKAEARSLSQESTQLLLTLLIIGIMAFLLRYYFTPKLHTTETLIDPKLEHQLWMERITNNCFVYQDLETGRTYPGVDVTLFTQDQLERCFSSSTPFAGIKITNFANRKEHELLQTTGSYETSYTLIYQNHQTYPAQLTLYLKS